jgi:hypothetical protein
MSTLYTSKLSQRALHFPQMLITSHPVQNDKTYDQKQDLGLRDSGPIAPSLPPQQGMVESCWFSLQ